MGEMSKAWKRTFITLLLKRQDASKLNLYRPIGLCTTLYKICANLMVKRMKPILPCLTSYEVRAFVGECNFIENVLLV